ncbi:nitrate- and nitrite sensing domain-containing protein [Streptomyces sp. NPDC089919]|uniref:sensor histidine kinase n=1 Tax=Streptomyces sp. NPDC089919 TaxID=3155188 RepID=UPI0034384975
MQKKRSRRNGGAPAGPERTGDATGTGSSAGRPVRVRSRLVLGVAAVGLTVIGAGAPALVAASADLNDSQRLVTLGEQTRTTVSLAHALADERDAAVGYVADGRAGKGKAVLAERAARVDTQIAEAREGAGAALLRALDRVPAVREAARTGKGSALATHAAYTEVLGAVLAPSRELAERTPARAGAARAVGGALAPLGDAVEQASATRGLLVAALSVPEGEEPESVYNPVTGKYEEGEPGPEAKTRDELTVAGQRARVREQAALEDFDRSARPDVRETLAATVTGPEVKAAEAYLAKLTDDPQLSKGDRKLDPEAVSAALGARIDRMRSVESTLTGERVTALAALRDDDVTSGELLIGLIGLLFLVAVGISTAVARTLTQPLSVLRRGAERLASPDHEGGSDPVRFTGRNDEFAAVVRSLNEIHSRAEAQSTALHTRIAGLDADRRRLIDRNDALSAAKTGLDKELAELRGSLEEHRRILITTSVSLSLRTLGLVERQLAVIEQLESKEQDPDRLATLFKLDHLATVMRRHNENLLVLAGQEHGHGHAVAVPLVDVMRAAVSEIERYERVDLGVLPGAVQVAGHAADDISHVVAELLENATTFSPPDARVKVAGWVTDDGTVVVSVQDAGIGVTEDRLALLNTRLADPEAFEREDEAEHGLGLGLYVAGRLAARHGVTAELRPQRGGGTEALVAVPAALLPADQPARPEYVPGLPGAPALQLPGVIAEANSNVLPPRFRPEPEAGTEAEYPLPVPAPAEPADHAPAEPEYADHAPADQPYEDHAPAEPQYADPDPADHAPAEQEHAEPEYADHAPADQPYEDHAPAEPEYADHAPAEPQHAEQGYAAPADEIQAPAGSGDVFVPGQAAPADEAAGLDGVFTARPEAEQDAPDWVLAAPLPRPAEPDQHARPAEPAPQEPADEPTLQVERPRITDKGLPKRTPKVVPHGTGEVPRPAGRVDAEELRRRLGGFYQGARDGRRVADAELAEQRQRAQDEGDTVEEART